jgi:hypothetical protein
MTDTALVAFITASSTICGGIVAAVTSIVVHKSQLRAQERGSDTERAEQRLVRQQEIRREAYVRLLSRFDEVDSIMQKCWQLIPDPAADQLPGLIGEASNGISAMGTALIIVALEGAPEVADAGAAADDKLRRELASVTSQIRTADGTDQLLVQANEAFDRAVRDREEARLALAAAARRDLMQSQ